MEPEEVAYSKTDSLWLERRVGGQVACRDVELPGWVRPAVEAPSPPCLVQLEDGARGEVRCSGLEGNSQPG